MLMRVVPLASLLWLAPYVFSQPDEEPLQSFYVFTSPMEFATIMAARDCYVSPQTRPQKKDTVALTDKNARLILYGIYWTDVCFSALKNDSKMVLQHFRAMRAIKPYQGFPDISEFEPRLLKNPDNQDSIVTILMDAWFHVDLYLEENERSHEITTIYCGAVTEMLYLFCPEINAKDLKSWLFGMRLNMDELFKMMDKNPSDELDWLSIELTALRDLLPVDDDKKKTPELTEVRLQQIKECVAKIRRLISSW